MPEYWSQFTSEEINYINGLVANGTPRDRLSIELVFWKLRRGFESRKR